MENEAETFPAIGVFSHTFLILILTITPSFAIDSAVEKAVLDGNWEEIYKLLEKDDKKASDPVARFLMAHACFATNRNNEASMLFLSVKEEKDLKSWSEWTDALLLENPEHPIALYFPAHAKIILGNLDETIQELTKAIKINPKFTLAYSNRGLPI